MRLGKRSVIWIPTFITLNVVYPSTPNQHSGNRFASTETEVPIEVPIQGSGVLLHNVVEYKNHLTVPCETSSMFPFISKTDLLRFPFISKTPATFWQGGGRL